MGFAHRLFAASMASLLGMLTLGGAETAYAQTIDNTASASWVSGGGRQSVPSNRVTLEITSAPPAVLQTFVPSQDGKYEVSLEPSYCVTAAGVAVPSALRSQERADSTITPATSLRIGQTLVISIDAQAANRDPGVKDVLTLRIVAPNGDTETLTAVETQPDSGVFFASIATVIFPPPYTSEDCRLSVSDGDTIAISAFIDGEETPFLVGGIDALADPFGVVFDSLDGTFVDGARVTIVDAGTGQPAEVFALDGVTPWPATLITGSTVSDASGATHQLAPGEYRFPLVAFGTYRLKVEPPAPYTAPSAATPAQLADLRDGNNEPFDISGASYGDVFTVDSLLPIRTDIPVDAPGGDITVDKRAFRELAEPGDVIFYAVTIRNTDRQRPSRALTLTDTAATGLRLRPGSVRVDGAGVENGLTFSGDGRGFSLAIGPIPGGEIRRVTYAMGVRDDAPVGHAPNRAVVSGLDGTSAEAQASVRIQRRSISDRFTIIGRVVDGACGSPAEARGIPGVRVMLEDGSFTITDHDGRYHFEGVFPGNHVVQVARHTLPQGGAFVDCVRSSRSQGSAISRLVTGQGGSLARADFHASLPAGTDLDAITSPQRGTLDNVAASGAETDFLALGDGPDGFVFPTETYNPRAPSARVVVRHRAGQKATLTANGEAVDALAFDGVKTSPDKTYAVSVWRAIALEGPDTTLRATVVAKDGTAAGEYERNLHYAKIPIRAEIVADQSRLIADGAAPPLLALRMTDRFGKPVHAGVAGRLELSSPYQARSAFAARQSAELTGFGDASASWVVEGDDGIAYIELAPTMVSGALRATFEFTDGDNIRKQEIEAWLEPGDAPWTVIGIAEGSIGARTIADNMERSSAFDSDLGDKARVALYAKGRILGQYLLTVAYDSAKQRDEQRLLGTIDPAAYYSVFGDNAVRAFDAASRDKIYVRVESSTFYALYGDFETGFDQTYLARYQRIATGVKAEARIGQAQIEGFAANAGSRLRREEMQGNGLSGPYQLASRGIIPNSETIVLETRDRLRSEIILDQRTLVRFLDYDIDLLSGTIRFARPVLSRDASLNPQFIVIEYSVDTLGAQKWNAGARASWTSKDRKIRIGATGVTDKGDASRTNLGAVDARIALSDKTELRAEAAMSKRAGSGNSANAYIAEIEHHSGDLDLLAYARQVDEEFGVGQQNVAERGRRKIGADARVRLNDALSIVASAWHDESLTDAASRDAVETRLTWRSDKTDAFVGVAHLSDTLADGTSGSSSVLQAGATQRLFSNKLEIVAATSVPLGSTASIDLPTQHSLGIRYAVTPDVKAIASYEIARGDAIDANSVKVGAEFTPWKGGRLVGALGRDAIGRETLTADAQRTFAAFSLGHSFRVGERLTIDATFDHNRTLSGNIAVGDTVNPAQPAASGGQLGAAGSLGEDFTAFTLGAAWGSGPWNARVRTEYRDGEFADRMGADLAVIRKLGNGSVVGSGFTWTRAEDQTGGSTQIVNAAVTLAHRPDDSEVSFLGKLEYRGDSVENAIAGEVGAAGQTSLLAFGDARLRRLIAGLSTNWRLQDDETSASRTEIAIFTGLRHTFDQVEGFSLKGTSLLGGLDLRIGLGERFEIGGRASVRHDLETGTTSFAIGPEIGFVPAGNVLVSVGYNITGFRDPDYSEARFTDKGLFASIRVKLDDDLFGIFGNRR